MFWVFCELKCLEAETFEEARRLSDEEVARLQATPEGRDVLADMSMAGDYCPGQVEDPEGNVLYRPVTEVG